MNIVFFIGIGITLLLVYAEMFFHASWSQRYFLSGIALYKKTFNQSRNEQLDLDYLARNTSQPLNPLLHKMVFHRQTDGKVLFREAVFQFGKFYFYPHLMHGAIVSNGSSIIVTGKVSWYVIIGTAVAVALFSVSAPKLIIYLALYTIVGYLIQIYRYNRITAMIANTE